MNPEERRIWIADEFERCFGAAPEIWTRAPGRVDLMGSHTDYNDGFILTMTIDRDTWVAARPRADRVVRVHSLNTDDTGEFALDDIQRDSERLWPNYVRGMAQVFQEADFALQGFDGMLHTTVPVSSGLSSSAALEMAVGRMFEAISGWAIDAVDLALLGQRAENHFVGVNCGILDQYTSAIGRAGCALLLDARSVTSRDVPIAPGIHVVICDTRAKRALAASQYGIRRAQCEEGALILGAAIPYVNSLRDLNLAQFDAHVADLDPIVAKRCRFIVEENVRVLAMADALAAGDRVRIQALTASSYVGARDLYEIVVPEMVTMMDAMLRGPGIIGARQAGAGFGGCMVAFVESDALDAFAVQVAQTYQSATGVQPNVYAVHATEGAGVIACRDDGAEETDCQ
jgi:galactokinase